MARNPLEILNSQYCPIRVRRLLHPPSHYVRHGASGESRKFLYGQNGLGSSLQETGPGGRGGHAVDLESGARVASRRETANSAQPC